MSNRLFEIPAIPEIPVTGENGVYPVHRVFCVGRNYAAHAAEMGVEVDREAPFYFTKSPASAIQATGATVPYPPGTENFHYEMELVIAIGAPAFKVNVADASAAIFGFACGLDMTRRDLQTQAKDKKRPWDLGKDVERSAVISALTRSADTGPLDPKTISLSVDDVVKQNALLSDMIHKVPEIISHLSGYYHLVPGDLIFTGTPAGVGAVVAGHHLEGQIDGLAPVSLTIGAAEE